MSTHCNTSTTLYHLDMHVQEKMAFFSINVMVQGYHTYWNSNIGENCPAREKSNNRQDHCAITMMKAGTVVGHISRKMSTLCSFFIHHGGKIDCTVTGGERHSYDLPQGGLEIPCTLKFEDNGIASSKEMAKTSELLM